MMMMMINKIKNDQLNFIKIGRFSSNVRNGYMDAFLNVYFLFQVFIFKNAWNTAHNISRCKNGRIKLKVPWLSLATLGFKSLILQRLNLYANL